MLLGLRPLAKAQEIKSESLAAATVRHWANQPLSVPDLQNSLCI